MSSARELLRLGTSRLSHLPGADAARDASLLLMKAAGFGEAVLWSSLDERIPPPAEARFRRLVDKRRARFPLALLTEEKEFWSLSFRIFPGVFIPRPETEHLVEVALRLSPRRGRPVIIEAGTGSGCIAIALARELPSARIFAIDRSRRAIRAAKFNAARHGITSVTWLEGDLFVPLAGRAAAGKADLVLSNPPYIPDAEWGRLDPEVRKHEPWSALAGGPDGLDFIRRLAAGARTRLRRGGWLVFEVGAGQDQSAFALFGEDWESPRADPDLAGISRVISVRRR